MYNGIEPLFALGGTIYPHDPSFDWSRDVDVLTDAVRETHVALRFHHIACLTPERDWLQCECADPAAHATQLMAGHLSLVNILTRLLPDVAHRASSRWRLPVNGYFIRTFNSILVTLTSFHLLPML